MKHLLKVCFLGPVLLCIAGLSVSWAQDRPNIRNLTSEETAQKAQSGQLEQEPRSSGRVISNINNHYFGVGVGQTFLKSDMKKHGDNRIGFDLMYVYTASLSFDFMASLHSHSHKRQDDKVTNTGLALGIKGRFYQYDNFAPYVLGGFGFYLPRVTRQVNGAPLKSDSKLTFGNHLGLGAELKLNRKVTVGTLIHWHNPFNIQQDIGPDVRGSYYKLMMTALYSF